ncbi:MAG: hypothetical protein LLG40_15580 [Deltaproteobacteria bacterium]|nr:hypothetical protein [Deltaproteobacteria bacterium]
MMSSKIISRDCSPNNPNGAIGNRALQKIPKTGVAKIMREWMKARTGTKAQRRFTIEQICDALGIKPGVQHQAVANALSDFMRRKEIETYFNKKHNRRQFLYVHDWHKELRGKINRKLFKAMYVSQDFSVTDIKRLSGLADRNWIDKVVRKLKKDGYIQQIQRRLCAHGAGAEAVWHVVNRDKFNTELMREKK